METSNTVFLTVKAAIVTAAAGFTAAFGWLGWLVLAWVLCMAIDWITGSLSAAKGGEWNSKRAREGAFHKAGMIAVVLVAALADFVITVVIDFLPVTLPFAFTGFILPLVLVWLIVTELGSILENAVTMGAPCPDFLKKILKIVSA
ncbi:MAG: phage holin family protein, partial [Oscillospiraceae bacterium]